MAIEVTMPKLSDSMEEGKVIEWKKKVGDKVTEGDILVEIESDKAVMELESFWAGTLDRIIHESGDVVKVGEPIAVIAESAEKVARPEVPAREEKKAVVAEAPRTPEVEARPKGAPVEITPHARKLAWEGGVDLSRVKGSGPGGRITAEDVLAAAGEVIRAEEGKPPDEELPQVTFAPDEAEVEEVSFYQMAVIRRVVASKHVIPHFYMTKVVNADRLLAEKEEHKGEFEATITHYVMKAGERALRKFPEVARSYDRGRWIKWKKINLGLAVETDAGLVVAVLRDAGGKDLTWIVRETRALVERARQGKLRPEDRGNPTFTVSNLGMLDVESFQAIINPPSSTTLAVGSILPTPYVMEGKVQVANVMKLTLSCDHRVIDGVIAANFLGEIKWLLENPHEMFERT